MSAFEDFVNLELPKRVSTGVPGGGNLAAGKALQTTGVGLGVEVVDFPGGGSTEIVNETPTGVKDGVNKVYTTASNFVAGTTKLYIGGLRQKLTSSYTESGVNEITMTDLAPISTDEMIIDYVPV